MLWTRLDRPGHDCCRLHRLEDGWRLAGTAVFLHRVPCSLQYRVWISRNWENRRGLVEGHVGKRLVRLDVRGPRGGWRVNGLPQPKLAGGVDLDLGFSPATNLIPIRRLALRVGERRDAPAAYLAFPRLKFEVLPQSYFRSARFEYEYASPTKRYSSTLTVTRDGWVSEYPALFRRGIAYSRTRG